MIIPKIRQLPSGKFFCRLRIDGKDIGITEATEERCMARALAIKTGLVEEKNAPASSLTLRKAIDKYIADRELVLSPSTIRGYRTIQRSRFQRVADKPIGSIRNWQRIVSDESAICSPKTLKNSWMFVCSVLRYFDIDAPNVRLPQIVSEERPFLEPEQIPVFVENIKDKLCGTAALLALHSLRRSEILGLDWENVNLKEKTITVRGSVVYDEGEKQVYKATNKNTASARTVPIMIPALYDLLCAVPDKTGKVVKISPNAIFRGVNVICEDLGFPKVGIHGLRHSFASLAYHLGLSEKETMLLGGWADSQTMRNIYTHLAEKDRLKAENKLHAFFTNRQ